MQINMSKKMNRNRIFKDQQSLFYQGKNEIPLITPKKSITTIYVGLNAQTVIIMNIAVSVFFEAEK